MLECGTQRQIQGVIMQMRETRRERNVTECCGNGAYNCDAFDENDK
jgi:hypothetical protein